MFNKTWLKVPFILACLLLILSFILIAINYYVLGLIDKLSTNFDLFYLLSKEGLFFWILSKLLLTIFFALYAAILASPILTAIFLGRVYASQFNAIMPKGTRKVIVITYFSAALFILLVVAFLILIFNTHLNEVDQLLLLPNAFLAGFFFTLIYCFPIYYVLGSSGEAYLKKNK